MVSSDLLNVIGRAGVALNATTTTKPELSCGTHLLSLLASLVLGLLAIKLVESVSLEELVSLGGSETSEEFLCARVEGGVSDGESRAQGVGGTYLGELVSGRRSVLSNVVLVGLGSFESGGTGDELSTRRREREVGVSSSAGSPTSRRRRSRRRTATVLYNELWVSQLTS